MQKALKLISIVSFMLIVILAASAQGQTTLTFNPSDDTEDRQENPSINYCTLGGIDVRNIDGGSLIYEWNAYAKFDISAISAGATITSATLHLYYYQWNDNNPSGRPLTCTRITEDWAECTLTYSNHPAVAATATSSSNVPGSYQWMTWDVTTDVQSFVAGLETNRGWKIMDETAWGGGNIPIVRFYSTNHGSLIPYLEIEYSEPIPTLSEWGYIVLVLLLVVTAFFVMRRRRREATSA